VINFCRKRLKISTKGDAREASTGMKNSATIQIQSGKKKMRKVVLLLAVASVFAAAVLKVTPSLAQDARRMGVEELKSMLGNPDFVVIDVRAGEDWKSSTLKIKGAIREDPEKVDTWMNKYPKDNTLLFYCA
jgi:hypothetical protein